MFFFVCLSISPTLFLMTVSRAPPVFMLQNKMGSGENENKQTTTTTTTKTWLGDGGYCQRESSRTCIFLIGLTGDNVTTSLCGRA